VTVDTWDGDAWISLVLFRLQVRPAWWPFLPGLSSLTEINLRTYVRCGGRPGIWFLTMHADNRWAIRLARLLTPLPYQYAPMVYHGTEGIFRFQGSGGLPNHTPWSLTFQPQGKLQTAKTEARDAWLLERYRAFVPCPRRHLVEAEVTHPPWKVQAVEVLSDLVELREGWGLTTPRPPTVLHFSPGTAAQFGRFRRALLPGEKNARRMRPPNMPSPLGTN
jgi:hypothetical protein